jgi:hypothetical protein
VFSSPEEVAEIDRDCRNAGIGCCGLQKETGCQPERSPGTLPDETLRFE